MVCFCFCFWYVVCGMSRQVSAGRGRDVATRARPSQRHGEREWEAGRGGESGERAEAYRAVLLLVIAAILTDHRVGLYLFLLTLVLSWWSRLW